MKITALFILLIFAGCSSITPTASIALAPSHSSVDPGKDIEINPEDSLEEKSLNDSFQNLAQLDKDYEVQTVKVMQSSSDSNNDDEPVVDQKSDLHLTYIPKYYKFWLKYYTKRDKERFIRHMKNGEKYRTLIQSVFKNHGLPEDLYYVGLIESGYNTRIRSHAGAVGPWQFIKGTATRYGMKVNSAVDERRNIHKATESAASYFKDLYNIFGSWELALCAYNAGEYRIIGAIRKGNTRDYIQLVKKKLLPKETIYYVPKVAAAREMSANREKYGLNVKVNNDSFYTDGEIFKMTKNFDLKDISKKLKIAYSTLRKLNPDIRYRSVRASKRRPFRIVIPDNKLKTMASIYPDLNSRVVTRRIRRSTGKTSRYKVRRGDNLHSIAARFNTTVHALRNSNTALKRRKLWAGESLRIPGGQTQTKVYIANRGDNLYKIAARFNTTVSELRSLNSVLRRRKLWAGQKLQIPSFQSQIYIVKRGDNLSKIANKFGTSIGKILAINSLKSKKIYPKQRLKVPSSG